MFPRSLSFLISSLRTRKVSGVTIYPLDTFLQPREQPMMTLLRLGVQQYSAQQKQSISQTWSDVLSGLYYSEFSHEIELYNELVGHYCDPQSWVFCDPGGRAALKAIRAAGVKVGALSQYPCVDFHVLAKLDIEFDAIISDMANPAKEMTLEGGKILSVTSPLKIPGATTPSEEPMKVMWGRDVKTLAEVAALAGVIV